MFRIKCINKLLPTKNLCFQRDPVSYKSKTYIACYAKEESLEHLADCQIYLKIWEKLEEIVIEELESKIFDRWKLSTSRQELKATLLGSRLEDKLAKRKLYIQGLTSTSLIAEMKEILGSETKVSKAVCWFTELF